MSIWKKKVETTTECIQSNRCGAPISALFASDSEEDEDTIFSNNKKRKKRLQRNNPQRRLKQNESSATSKSLMPYRQQRQQKGKHGNGGSINSTEAVNGDNGTWVPYMLSEDELEDMIDKEDKREERMKGERYCKLCDHGGPHSKDVVHRDMYERIMGIERSNRHESLCRDTLLNRMKLEYDENIQAPLSERGLDTINIEMRDLRRHFKRNGGCGVNLDYMTDDIIKGAYLLAKDLRKRMRYKNKKTNAVQYNWPAVAAYDKIVKNYMGLGRLKVSLMSSGITKQGSSSGGNSMYISRNGSKAICNPKGSTKADISVYQLGNVEC